ncbi:MAG TPA: fumarylacetoacetate hydrolase family protein [Candidatus Eremiobacteraceae bacterium]|nr:fumarylacetoacetate hydrolase family protein [Candidatus Eremiobacteraceae bacterium]
MTAYVRYTGPDGAPRDGMLEGTDVVSGGSRTALGSVRLLAPCTPTKIVCVGRNYADHAKELGSTPPVEPLLFFKPPSAVIGPGDDIVYPRQSRRVDYEGELAAVIGRRCRDVSPERARDFVRGFTVFNDVTARDLQRTDDQWARAKGFDTFASIGPCIVDGVDPSKLRIRTTLNGEVMQEAPTSLMLVDVWTLIAYASAAFTLEPGDVLATGTPSGVGPMQPGDVVSVEIDGIGTLTNRVVSP